jgi:hypothetical protein
MPVLPFVYAAIAASEPEANPYALLTDLLERIGYPDVKK